MSRLIGRLRPAHHAIDAGRTAGAVQRSGGRQRHRVACQRERRQRDGARREAARDDRPPDVSISGSAIDEGTQRGSVDGRT